MITDLQMLYIAKHDEMTRCILGLLNCHYTLKKYKNGPSITEDQMRLVNEFEEIIPIKPILFDLAQALRKNTKPHLEDFVEIIKREKAIGEIKVNTLEVAGFPDLDIPLGEEMKPDDYMEKVKKSEEIESQLIKLLDESCDQLVQFVSYNKFAKESNE